MAHGHAERGISALLRRHPEIREFRGFRIIRADHHALGAAVTRLGIEVRVGRARLRHVRAPKHQEACVKPIGAFRNVSLLAPGLWRGWRQVAIPIVERHADAAEQRQITRTGRVAHHRHRRDRREAEHAVRPVGFRRIGIGRRNDFVDLVPGRADETAEAALAHIGGALGWVFDDRLPGGDRRPECACLAPQLKQPRTHQRKFHAVAGIQIPAIARPARAAARLVVGQVGPRAWIICLLCFPGDDAALDVNLPGARSGAVHAMRRAHNLVVLPALAVTVLPAPILVGHNAVAVGKIIDDTAEERQAIKKMTYCPDSFIRPVARRRAAAGGSGRPRSMSRNRPPRRV